MSNIISSPASQPKPDSMKVKDYPGSKATEARGRKGGEIIASPAPCKK